MALIPKPQFPNVPKLPGVPQLNRSLLPQFAAGPPPVLTSVIALGRLLLAVTTKPQWGIYKIEPPEVNAATTDDELDEVVVKPPPQPVIVPDSFGRFQYTQESQVTTAPVQEGAFASFNKVATPFEIRVRMVKVGTLAQRQQFLETLDTISRSLDFYRILTPERSYLNTNITGYRIVRDGARDAYCLWEVEVSFVEIREVQAEYSSTAANTANAKTAAARPTVNRGTLNAIPPASRIATAVDKALAPLRGIAHVIGAG